MAETDQKPLYEWKAPEFSTGGAGGWSGWILVIVGLAAAWSVWAQRWALLAVAVMIFVVTMLMRRAKPRLFVYQLTSTGIMIGPKYYDYADLKSFWIVLGDESRAVNLLSNKKWGLMLTLQLGDANVDKVRETLAEFLPEDTSRGEDTVDRIGRFFRL